MVNAGWIKTGSYQETNPAELPFTVQKYKKNNPTSSNPEGPLPLYTVIRSCSFNGNHGQGLQLTKNYIAAAINKAVPTTTGCSLKSYRLRMVAT